MTNEEKALRMEQRNKEICAFYVAGNDLAACASKFGLKRQRLKQLLEKAGVWRPYEKSKRTKFLGVSLTDEDKVALREEADRDGMSMSALSSEWIRQKLAERRARLHTTNAIA
jgi:hypothetical protein